MDDSFKSFIVFIVTITVFSFLILGLASLVHFDVASASGKAEGFIFYQERNGWFNRNVICWKDTPYDTSCQFFDTGDIVYPPGKYIMNYNCSKFVWVWDKGSECSVIDAKRIGDIEYGLKLN